MTNKSLSQQLCEVCGIEPIKEPTRTYDTDGNVECEEIYPDFEHINFEKLFNLKYSEYDDDTIAAFIFFRYKNIINSRSFLGCLLFEIQHSRYKEVKQIKQAIKNEQWEV